jgi:peptidyl-prolyl cis-trans isomerase C
MANSLVRRLLGASSSRYLLFPALLLVGATLLTSCKQAVTDPKDPKFIVAEKAPWSITRADLDAEVASFLKERQTTAEQVGPAKMPIVETISVKTLVLKKLIADRAAALQIKDLDKDEAAHLDAIKASLPPGQDLDTQLKAAGMTMDDLKAKIHEGLLVQKVLEADAFKNVDPTEQQIDEIYTAHKDSFAIPAKVRASRVLIMVDDKASPADKAAKKKAIDAARARVAKGEDFSKVAMEVSQDQGSKAKGGDLGFFQKGENPDAGFDDVAFNTKQNVLSPVFLTPLGYQFIKVTQIQPAGTVSVADARNYISGKLKEQNMQVQAQAYEKKLLADSGVIYHVVLVDPPAQVMGGPGGPGGQGGGTPDQGGGAPPQGQDAGQQAPAPAPEASAPPAPASGASAPPAPAPAPTPDATAPAAPSTPSK